MPCEEKSEACLPPSNKDGSLNYSELVESHECDVDFGHILFEQHVPSVEVASDACFDKHYRGVGVAEMEINKDNVKRVKSVYCTGTKFYIFYLGVSFSFFHTHSFYFLNKGGMQVCFGNFCCSSLGYKFTVCVVPETYDYRGLKWMSKAIGHRNSE